MELEIIQKIFWMVFLTVISTRVFMALFDLLATIFYKKKFKEDKKNDR